MEKRDYTYFLYKLKAYLEPLPKYTNHGANVRLLAYALMPNHFHLIVRNDRQRGIEAFMRSLGTSYSMYFNKKYNRVGHLFQGSYKAGLIKSEGDLLLKTRYVHRNPEEIWRGNLEDYPYSNYGYYLQEKEKPWLDRRMILEYFQGGSREYKEFVEKNLG